MTTLLNAHNPQHMDTCCICLDKLQVDARTFVCAACCGKRVHTDCRANPSSMSQEQKSKCPHCQVKLPITHEEHFELVRRWADKGKAWAQASLGNAYRVGQGVGQSDEQAIRYLTLALQQNDSNAMFGLGSIWEQAKSFDRAIAFYTQATKQGHASAQCILGIMYCSGKHVEQSFEIGREWLTKAARQNEKTALKCLHILDKKVQRRSEALKLV